MSNKTPDLGISPGKFSFLLFFSSFWWGLFFFTPFSASPADNVQRAAHHQTGLRGRIQHDHGLQRKPLLLRVPRVRAAGYGAGLLKFCAIVGLGEKTRPASVSPSGQLKHRLTSSKKRGVGAANNKGVARGEGVSAAGLEIMGRREGGHPVFIPGARRQGIIRMGNSSPGRSG